MTPVTRRVAKHEPHAPKGTNQLGCVGVVKGKDLSRLPNG